MQKYKQKKQVTPLNTRGQKDKVAEVTSFIGPRCYLIHFVSHISWDHHGSTNAAGDKKAVKINIVTMGERLPSVQRTSPRPQALKIQLE